MGYRAPAGGGGSSLPADPNADRILMWDESAGSGGAAMWLDLAPSLAINGTTLGLGPYLTVTGGTITTNQPLLAATQTWNGAGQTFTAVLVNITDTASASASMLLDLQVAGASKFSVTKSGGAKAAALSIDTDVSDGNLKFTAGSGTGNLRGVDSQVIAQIGSTQVFNWTSTGILIMDGRNVSIGTSNGTKFATATNQRIGFYGSTPITQPSGDDQSNFDEGTGGSITGEVIDVGNPPDQMTINNNFTELCYRVKGLRSALVALGLIKGGP